MGYKMQRSFILGARRGAIASVRERFMPRIANNVWSLPMSISESFEISVSLGYGLWSYKRLSRPTPPSEYMESSKEIEGIKINGTSLNENQVKEYSDNIKLYADFIKQHSTRDIKFGLDFTSTPSPAFVANDNLILIDPSTLLPTSVESDPDELKAIIMHEIGHIEYRHGKWDKFIIPPVITGCSLMPPKYGYPVFSLLFGFLIYRQRQYEYQADAHAVKHGYGPQLKSYFERSLNDNKRSNSMWMTASGEYLLDIMHPPLQNRIEHIDQLIN
jgi:hypothetical protein